MKNQVLGIVRLLVYLAVLCATVSSGGRVALSRDLSIGEKLSRSIERLVREHESKKRQKDEMAENASRKSTSRHADLSDQTLTSRSRQIT